MKVHSRLDGIPIGDEYTLERNGDLTPAEKINGWDTVAFAIAMYNVTMIAILGDPAEEVGLFALFPSIFENVSLISPKANIMAGTASTKIVRTESDSEVDDDESMDLDAAAGKTGLQRILYKDDAVTLYFSGLRYNATHTLPVLSPPSILSHGERAERVRKNTPGGWEVVIDTSGEMGLSDVYCDLLEQHKFAAFENRLERAIRANAIGFGCNITGAMNNIFFAKTISPQTFHKWVSGFIDRTVAFKCYTIDAVFEFMGKVLVDQKGNYRISSSDGRKLDIFSNGVANLHDPIGAKLNTKILTFSHTIFYENSWVEMPQPTAKVSELSRVVLQLIMSYGFTGPLGRPLTDDAHLYTPVAAWFISRNQRYRRNLSTHFTSEKTSSGHVHIDSFDEAVENAFSKFGIVVSGDSANFSTPLSNKSSSFSRSSARRSAGIKKERETSPQPAVAVAARTSLKREFATSASSTKAVRTETDSPHFVRELFSPIDTHATLPALASFAAKLGINVEAFRSITSDALRELFVEFKIPALEQLKISSEYQKFIGTR